MQVLQLGSLGARTLRYFALVSDDRSSVLDERGAWLIARAELPKKQTMPRTTMADFATVMLSLWPRPGVGYAMATILRDYSQSHNLMVRHHQGQYYAIGGAATFPNRRELKNDPRARNDLRDGVRLLRADSLAAVRRGQWLRANHSSLPLVTASVFHKPLRP